MTASLQVAAQGLVVKNFYHAERDFTANSGSTLVLDHNNGDPCALIKVRTMQKGLTFDAGRLFPIEKTEEQGGAHPLDIYVWVQSGATIGKAMNSIAAAHRQILLALPRAITAWYVGAARTSTLGTVVWRTAAADYPPAATPAWAYALPFSSYPKKRE